MKRETLLCLLASARGTRSASTKAAKHACDRLALRYLVKIRDLHCPVHPHPSDDYVEAALRSPLGRELEADAALALSEELISEFEQANYVLIAMPLHNFMVPSVFKAWIDLVVRVHRTFTNGTAGKRGLLSDRPVRILIAAGGAVGQQPGDQPDLVSPYLRHVFRTVGIEDLDIFFMQNQRRSTEQIANAQQSLENWLELRVFPTLEAVNSVDSTTAACV